jgi:hypothetical protein
MKTRNGFVSNSSSSSFIVAVEPDTRLVLNIDIDDECATFTTEEELRSSEQYKDQTDEELLDDSEYQKQIKAIKKGKVIKAFVASNDDYDYESFTPMMYGKQLTKKMIKGKASIIQSGDY